MVKNIKKTWKKENQKSLHQTNEEKLLTLRQLHIVHAEIKPENILFSPGWNNVVLVDFGLAMIVKELVNEETETGFFGTPHFAGDEMK